MKTLFLSKKLDRSLLHWGTTIPQSSVAMLDDAFGGHLQRGEAMDLQILIGSSEEYSAQIRNTDRAVTGDTYQLRYDSNEALKACIRALAPSYVQRVETEHERRKAEGQKRPRTDTRLAPTCEFHIVPGLKAIELLITEQRSKAPEALVLVENEATYDGTYDFWADETGARYHFPNHYRNRVQPGLPFIYYKGSRRSDGKRGTPEYFGSGVIGDVWLDPSMPEDTPKSRRRWYCAIEQYQPFASSVPHRENGRPYESVKTSRDWGVAVRPITLNVYHRILAASNNGASPGDVESTMPTPRVAEVVESSLADLVITRPPSVKGNTSGAGPRVSTRTKEIGDWSERFVIDWLTLNLAPTESDTLKWIAQLGETPGWDIEYVSAGRRVAVEVKSTVSTRFSGIDISANEWKAAMELRSAYVLALVTGATTSRPRIAFVKDPAVLTETDNMALVPSSYRLLWISPETLNDPIADADHEADQ